MLPTCALALVLMADISGSVTPESYKLQQQGTSMAFRAPEIHQTIESKDGGIAVAYVEWGSSSKVVIKWRVLKTKEDSNSMADALLDISRTKFLLPTTAVADSIYDGIKLFETVPCNPERKVIDVSGDGVDNQSARSIKEVIHVAVEEGITINGLPIESNDDDVVSYYKENIITPDGFAIIAKNFKDFARAVRKKISLEIM